MSTSMQDTTVHITIDPRELRVQEGDVDVWWQESGDLNTALKVGSRKTKTYVPTLDASGLLVIALNMDGEGSDEVMTEMPAGPRSTSLEVIERAIRSLQVLAVGVRATSREATS